MSSSWRLWLPPEHGVWGLIAGAALVGLSLSVHPAGLPLLLAAIVAVLLRSRLAAGPLGWLGWLSVAWIAGLCLLLTWRSGAPGWSAWVAGAVLVAATLLVLPRRSLVASLVGGLTFAALAGAVACAGGAVASHTAIGVGVLAWHFIAMVPLVRAQVRKDSRWSTLAVELHVLALLAAAGLHAIGAIPWTIPVLAGLGLARCACIVHKHSDMRPARIGTRELAWLPVVAAALALGLRGGAW